MSTPVTAVRGTAKAGEGVTPNRNCATPPLMREVEESKEKSNKRASFFPKPQSSKARIEAEEDMEAVKNSLASHNKESNNQGSGSAGASSSTAPVTPKFNRRGQKIPNKSPDGLLTGDRTGAEGSAHLVSPISYGRTTRSASNKGDVKVE